MDWTGDPYNNMYNCRYKIGYRTKAEKSIIAIILFHNLSFFCWPATKRKPSKTILLGKTKFLSGHIQIYRYWFNIEIIFLTLISHTHTHTHTHPHTHTHSHTHTHTHTHIHKTHTPWIQIQNLLSLVIYEGLDVIGSSSQSVHFE